MKNVISKCQYSHITIIWKVVLLVSVFSFVFELTAVFLVCFCPKTQSSGSFSLNNKKHVNTEKKLWVSIPTAEWSSAHCSPVCFQRMQTPQTPCTKRNAVCFLFLCVLRFTLPRPPPPQRHPTPENLFFNWDHGDNGNAQEAWHSTAGRYKSET